jgi:hypothetical protein
MWISGSLCHGRSDQTTGIGELEHVATITFDEFKALCLLRDDGMYLGSPMMVHIRMLKAFLHYYKRRSRGRTFPHNEDDVLEYTKLVFNEYCRSDFYTKDVSTGGLLSTSMVKTAPPPYSSQGHILTVQVFRHGVKRDTSTSTRRIVVLLQQLVCIILTWF